MELIAIPANGVCVCVFVFIVCTICIFGDLSQSVLNS